MSGVLGLKYSAETSPRSCWMSNVLFKKLETIMQTSYAAWKPHLDCNIQDSNQWSSVEMPNCLRVGILMKLFN